MKLVVAFLKLIRLPNLFFLALTQVLFQYCIYLPIHQNNISGIDTFRFIFIVAASVFIAAAGYVINDYFDINIDSVNKPDQMVVDKIISRRWAIAWHFMLSVTGIIFTLIALPFRSFPHLILANLFCVMLLWFYSTHYKKSLAVGNIVISLLTAWTVLIIFFSKYPIFFSQRQEIDPKFFRLSFLYASFAFVISLVREAVKDMEDVPGDAKNNCKTMPIVWGMNATKVYVAVWIIVLIAALIVVQIYVMQYKWWLPVTYSFLLVIAPLVYIFYKLFKAKTPKQFHHLSSWSKFVMLTGILSMIFFYFYL